MPNATDRIDLYADITNRIIAELERGPDAWVKSWTTSGAETWRPVNHTTERAYRGINVLLLALVCSSRGYLRNRWLTFQQALACGGAVRKGAKGVRVTFWRPLRGGEAAPIAATEPTGDDEKAVGMVLRHFTVFNVADIDGITAADTPTPADDSLPSRVVVGSGARIVRGSPCYRPAEDIIALPPADDFDSVGDYYVTAFHELVHWTGPRLGREVNSKRFGDDAYAIEELVAELGAAMVSGACSLPTLMQSASYLDHWLRVLRQDKRAIFAVAGAAQRAADYLLAPTGDSESAKAAE
jgi:antirestriction protein ArdC